ncbi:MAG: hypothetical protein NTY65_07380 [Planctomycetota bacterium]|nr:hypothetical protein [Planctomycetota bacterium]
MVLSKSQISLLAVLGMSVIGMLVDWFILPSSDSLAPAKAAASAPAPPAAAAPVGASPAAAAPAKAAGAPAASVPGAVRIPLAERLKALALEDRDPTAIREAFAPSAAWLASLEVAKPGGVPRPDSALDFSQQHKLTSILRRGSAGSAIVNGKVVEIGEQVDGYRLIGLTADSAVFQSPRHPKEVKLTIVVTGK